jgi:hypothetical protein
MGLSIPKRLRIYKVETKIFFFLKSYHVGYQRTHFYVDFKDIKLPKKPFKNNRIFLGLAIYRSKISYFGIAVFGSFCH